MTVRLLLEGKIRDKHVEAFVLEYKKRLSPFFDFEIVESFSPKPLKFLQQSDVYIGMDVLGKRFDTHSFSIWFDQKRIAARSINFIIGEADGLTESSRRIINEYISLSDLTFSFRVSLMVLAEQIYRSMTIITGHPYHK